MAYFFVVPTALTEKECSFVFGQGLSTGKKHMLVAICQFFFLSVNITYFKTGCDYYKESMNLEIATQIIVLTPVSLFIIASRVLCP